jgi:hypothetical protein
VKTKNQLRILIDSEAQLSLEAMLESLKTSGEFIKINPSRLVSWIVTQFKAESFELYKSQILQDNFNSKGYLRDLATKIQSSDDAAAVLAAALQKIQIKNKKSVVKKLKENK